MNFTEIAENRQSCRSYNSEREVEEEKLTRILESARLAPRQPATVSLTALQYVKMKQPNWLPKQSAEWE